MYCPACRMEYEVWMTECSDCGVALVPELPAEQAPEYVEMVTVLATGNPALIAIAKSLLEEAEIRYFVKGEGLQDLFAAGRLGVGFNPIVGPVEIQVDRQDAKEARALLVELEEGDADDSETQS